MYIVKGTPVRKKIRQILKYTIFFLVLCILFILSVFSGIWLVFQVKESLTFKIGSNVTIKLTGLSIQSGIRFKNVVLDSTPYHFGIELDDVHIQFFQRGFWDYIVSIDNCTISAKIQMEKGNSINTNQGSTIRDWEKDINEYIKMFPINLGVKNIDIYISKNGDELALEGLRLEADRQRMSASLVGETSTLDITYKGKKEKRSGRVNIDYRLLPKCHELNTLIQFDPHILISSHISADGLGKQLKFNNVQMSLDEESSLFLSVLTLPILGMPLFWEKVDIKKLEGTFRHSDFMWFPEEVNGDVYIKSLTIGETTKPWFRYSTTLNIHSESVVDGSSTIVELSTYEEPEWNMQWKYEYLSHRTEFSFATKKPIRSAFIQEISPYWYDTLMLKQIAPFEINVSSALAGDMLNLQGTMNGQCSFSGEQKITLDSQVLLNFAGKPEIKWEGTAFYLKHPIHFTYEGLPYQDFHSSLQTETIPMKYFIKLLPTLMVKPLENAVGNCIINMNGNIWEDVKLNINGTIQPQKEDEEFPPIVPSQYSFVGVLKNMQVAEGKFSLISENSTDFKLDPCKLHLFPLSLEGKINTKIYLSTISSVFMPMDVMGKVNFQGNLFWDGGMQIRMQGIGDGEGVGIAGYALPEGANLYADGEVLIDFSNYAITIEQLKAGINNNTITILEKSVFNFPQNEKPFSLSLSQFSIDGDISKLYELGIDPESKGKCTFHISDLSFTDNHLTKGNVSWNLNIEKYNQPSWFIQAQNIITQGQAENIGEMSIPINITLDQVGISRLLLKQIENDIKVHVYPPQMELNKVTGHIWGGTFEAKGTLNMDETGFIGKINGLFKNIDLALFTEELQPPWIKLTGIAHGTFDLNMNLTSGELIDGNINIICPQGLTINRDVLMQLILYLQNVSIVQKQLEKLLGQEDPKSFNKGELNIGFKDNQATISLLLSTPNLDLAPVFYINADWKMLWSLLTTPSNVQIEIK